MEGARFTALAQSLLSSGTRRGVLRGLAGGILGVVVAADAADARREHRQGKRPKAPGAANCTVCKDRDDCPFTSIQAAIAAAAPGSTIVVCDGQYNEDITIGKSLTLAAAAGAKVELDGSGETSVVTVPRGVRASLQGMEITDGGGTRMGNTRRGGAIYNRGTLTLTDMLIQDNQAREGAGIYNDLPGKLMLHHTVVQENDATVGGGIYNQGTLTVTDGSRIVENEAKSFGGGLTNLGGNATISGGSVVEQNKAGQGGGIVNSFFANRGATLTIDHSVVRDNTAKSRLNPTGGGIVNVAATVTLQSSQVVGNESAGQGGGITNSDGTVTLDAQSTVVNNKPVNCFGTPACPR